MKEFKRILSFALLLSMVLSMLPGVSLRAKAADTTWSLVTDASTIDYTGATEYLFVGLKDSKYYVAGTYTSSKFKATEITDSVSGNTISLADTVAADTFTFGGSAEGATIYSNLKSQYVGYNSSTNLKLGDDASANDFKWTVGTVADDNTVAISNVKTPARSICLNVASTIYIGPYATSTSMPQVRLYAKGSSGTDPDPTTPTTPTTPTEPTEPGTEVTFNRVTAVTSGKEYLIVCEDEGVAFDGSLTTLDAGNNVVTVTPADGVITGTSDLLNSVFTITASGTSYTIQSKSGLYIGKTTNSNGLNSSATTEYLNGITFSGTNAVINGADNSGAAIARVLRFNHATGSSGYRFRYYGSSTGKDIQLYERASGSTEPTEPSSDSSASPSDGSVTVPVGSYATSVKIITGEGTAYFLDGSNQPMAMYTKNGNYFPTGMTEVNVPLQDVLDPYYVFTEPGEYTLVMVPAVGQRLSCLEMGGQTVTDYEWNDTLGGYTYTFAVTKAAVTFRVSFLPNRGDTGITAILAEELQEGEYILTAPDGLTGYDYESSQTYLLYGSKETVLVDGSECVIGRKSAALRMSDIGVSIVKKQENTLVGLNEGAVFTIAKSDEEGYYTVKAYEPLNDSYICVDLDSEGYAVAKDLDITSDPSKDEAKWKLEFDSETHLTKFTSKISTKLKDGTLAPVYLKFNAVNGSKLFRAYTNNGDDKYPDLILYRASLASFAVNYSAATAGGSVSAVNGATPFASGSAQPKGSAIVFKAEALEGYQIDHATLNGAPVALEADGTYTVSNLEHKLNFVVYFKEEEKNNTITVKYWLNNDATAFDTRTVKCGTSYYMDLSGTITLNVEGVDKTFPVSDLQFNKAVKNNVELTGVTTTSRIPVANEDVIDLYFLTVRVKLEKTATETTKTVTSSQGKGGDTATGSFASTDGGNTLDANGNVQQIYTVNLKVSASEMIPGITEKEDTDVVLILDNSNSMHGSNAGGIDRRTALREAVNNFLDVVLADGTNNRVAVAWYGSQGHYYVIDSTNPTYPTATCNNQNSGISTNANGYDYCFTNNLALAKDTVREIYENYNLSSTDSNYDTLNHFFHDGGGTNMYMGYKAAERIIDGRYAAMPNTDRNLMVIMFTDGNPTYSDTSDQPGYNTVAEDGRGWTTCPGVHNKTVDEGSALRQSVQRFGKARLNQILSVALIPGSTEGEIAEAERILGVAGQTRRWVYHESVTKENEHYYPGDGTCVPRYYDLSDMPDSNSDHWTAIAPMSDQYYAITNSNADEASAKLLELFKQFSEFTTQPKYFTGTVTDIIPAGYELDEASLNTSGLNYTITANSDGTKTITIEKVMATEDGTPISYDLKYVGNGGGAYYTNQSASFDFWDFKLEKDVTVDFPKPVVEIIPHTAVDVSYTVVERENMIDTKLNDLFTNLEDAGHQIISTNFTLTDALGNPMTYKVNLTDNSGIDAVFTDPANGTLQTYSFLPGEQTLYYTVTMTVKDPNGNTYTVTSQATEVKVYISASTPDVDLVHANTDASVGLKPNDTLNYPARASVEYRVYAGETGGQPLSNSNLPEGFSAFTCATDGTVSYRTTKSGVFVFYYDVMVNDGAATQSLFGQRVPFVVISLDDAYIVLDFGLTTEEFEVYSFDGSFSIDRETKLKDLVSIETGDIANADLTTTSKLDENGTLTTAVTPRSILNQAEAATYQVTLAASKYSGSDPETVQANIHVIPANNVLYEESFLANLSKGWSTETSEGWVGEATQEANNTSFDPEHLHGFDQHYADSTSKYSGGKTLVATVSTTNRTETASFTFTGTGFDLISQVSKDSGVIVAKITGASTATYVVDNYFAAAEYTQIPAIAFRSGYGTYTVSLTAYYNAAFDHCGVEKAEVAKVLGMKEEDFVFVQAGDLLGEKVTRAPEAKRGQYNVYIDAIRIYQPLDAVPADAAALKAYQDDKENNSVFANLSTILKSADNWNGGSVGLGAIFLGEGSGNAEIDDEFGSTGIYLNSGDQMKYVEENGVKYLVNAENQRIQFQGSDVYFKERTSHETSEPKYSFYYMDTKTGQEVKLTSKQVAKLGIVLYSDKYEAIGPENEVYLKPGQGIGFKANGSNLQITVKSPDGKTNMLEAYKDGQWIPIAIVSNGTEMYYSLENCVNADGLVVVRCNEDSESFLSICNVKGTAGETDTQALVTIDSDTVYKAILAFRGDLELPPDPIEPTEPTNPTEPSEPSEPSEPTEPSDSSVPSTTEEEPKQDCDGGKDCPIAKFDDLNTSYWYHEGVEYAVTHGLMNGTGDGLFQPDNSLTRAMLVTILYRAKGEPKVEGLRNPFRDVADGLWYTDAVVWAAENGIVKGVTETEFAPDAPITREQIAVILYRYDGEKKTDANLETFNDYASVSAYAVDAMKWATAQGIINGMDGSLAPLENATRAQIAKILFCYLNQ